MRFETSEKYVLGKMLREAAQKYGRKTYFWFEGKEYTYAEVLDRSRRVAASLAGMGVKKGSHVAILMENCPEFIYTWFGLALLGASKLPSIPFIKGTYLNTSSITPMPRYWSSAAALLMRSGRWKTALAR